MSLPTARKSPTENPKGAAISVYPPMIGENASKTVAKAAAETRYEADWSRVEPMSALVLVASYLRDEHNWQQRFEKMR
jgi:hypothetical protein